MCAASWPAPDGFPVYITVVGGREQLYTYRVVRPGRGRAEVIELPGGQTLTIHWSHFPAPTAWRGEDRFIPWLRERFGRRASDT
jgi:hypothetical protein